MSQPYSRLQTALAAGRIRLRQSSVRLRDIRIRRCDACRDVSPLDFQFRDGLCSSCQAAGIERCAWCREPVPETRRGNSRGGDLRPPCAEGHRHAQCPACRSPLCPDSDEARVARAVMS